jgi:hypothetical protein
LPFATLGSNIFSGNQSVSGSVTATAFSGNGSALTGVNALSALTAASATDAASAASLNGVPASNFARLDVDNAFTGNQNITGNIAATGGITASGSLTIGGGTPISEYVSITHSITLPAINPGSCTTFITAAVTGFTPGSGDTIALGTPRTLLTGLGSGVFLVYEAWETTTTESPTITIRVCNPSSRYRGGNSGTIRIDIFKH